MPLSHIKKMAVLSFLNAANEVRKDFDETQSKEEILGAVDKIINRYSIIDVDYQEQLFHIAEAVTGVDL